MLCGGSIRTLVSAAFFCLGFLPIGMIGGQAVASLETLPSERIGAEAFLFLLCLVVSAFWTVCYAVGFEEFRRQPKWFTGLFGGMVAAGAFSASNSAAPFAGLGFGVSVALALVLPSSIGLLWPFLGAKVQDGETG